MKARKILLQERSYNRKDNEKGEPCLSRKLGDMVLIDCNVKGSDNGTPSDPEFALRTLWEHVILPAYDALTAVGGPAEGAVVVHQEDNASPHQEGDFHQWLMAELEQRGWRLELEAPQGPYTNVLDLQVFQALILSLNLNRSFEPGANPAPYPTHYPSPLRFPKHVPVLQVFPAMSKQHSHLLQMFNNTVAGYDRIWDVAQNVWKGITSSVVS